MTDREFFQIFIPALKKAINVENLNNFQSIGPDWFIEEKEVLKEIDSYEKKNYPRFELFFDLVGKYMDLRSHNFDLSNSEELYSIHKNLCTEINKIEKKFL